MGVLYARSGGAWVPVAQGSVDQRWFSAWGIVGIAPRSGGTIVVAANTAAAVTQPLAFTTVVGRRYRLHYHCRAMSIAAGPTDAAWTFQLYDGAVVTALVGDWHNSRLNYDNIDIVVVVDGDGAAHSWTMRTTAPANTGINVFDDTGCVFYVEDVGPVTGANLVPQVAVTPWTAQPYNGGAGTWGNIGTGNAPLQYRKVGDEVQIRGEVHFTSGGNPMAVLPAGFRPPYLQTFAIVNRATNGILQLTIDANGNLTIGGISGATDFGLGTIKFSLST